MQWSGDYEEHQRFVKEQLGQMVSKVLSLGVVVVWYLIKEQMNNSLIYQKITYRYSMTILS